MIKGGYILQPRRIDESLVSSFPPHVREIWLYFLRKANYKDHISSGKTIKRGQLLTSYRQIINDLSWYVGYRKESYKKHHCETATKLLMKENMITTMKTTRGMIVTVCKYELYQNPDNYETDSETDNGTDNEPTMNRHDKERKKESKERKETMKKDFSREREVLNHVSKFFDPKTIRKLSESDKTKWLDTIRLLHEKDGYQYEDISKAISFARQDEFWSGNVLSIPPLRSKKKGDVSKFEKIFTQMKRAEVAPMDDRAIIKAAFANKKYRPV